ncbi:MAG: superfamily protein [Crocinitomicaceae bacterium]|jgi:RES domain-containing protein|nr:superfamily protein [Crocinitomicaceae bacterium]
MIVYRLSKAKYASDLSGKGAEQTGGRWNSKGVAMLYTGQSRALCTTEIAVHTPLGILPLDYELITIHIPDDVKVKELKSLPEDLQYFPHSIYTRQLGDDFILKGKSAVLKVPSAVVQGEFNYLLNPAHPEFHKITVKSREPFSFDQRLFLK